MKETIKKLAALVLAAAMIVTFTPLYETGWLAYAEGEGNDAQLRDGEWDENIPFFELEQLTEGECRVYGDGEISFRIPDEALYSDDEVVEIEPFAGIPGDDGWDNPGGEWNNCYQYDDDSHIITIFGNVIQNMYPEPDYGAPDFIGISFKGIDYRGNTKWIAGTRDLQFRYAEVYYQLPEDETMLTEWDGSIDGTIRVNLWNTEYPDGGEEYINVEDIEIVQGAELLEDWHEDSDGDSRWWYYRIGRETGDVTFLIHYTDREGNSQTHETHLYIRNDVYRADIWSENNVYQALPGEEIYLNAWAEHEYKVGDHNETTQEGLDFEWSLERGEHIAQLFRDENDHSQARLVFTDMEPGEEGRWDGCRVKLTVKDTTDEDDPDGEKVIETRWFNCNSEFYDVYPLWIENNIGIGMTTPEYNLEVRHYKYNGTKADGYNIERYKIINAGTTWFDFDNNAISVRVNGNREVSPGEQVGGVKKFSFERRNVYDTEVCLNVDFMNEYGDVENIEKYYNFGWLNYDIWFNSDDDRIYDDGELTMSLGTRDDLDYSAIEIRYTVTGYRYNDYMEDGREEVEVPSECYNIAPDNMSVTFIGEKLAKLKVDEIMIEAEAFYGSESLGSRDERWLIIEDSCTSRGETHLWLSLPEYPDCTSKGTMKQICWNCGERRVISVPARGHIAKEVKAVASTASKEGNIQYWKCADCGKLFSDAACKKQITKDSTIIPKGVSLKSLTAQKKGLTVKWEKAASPYINHISGYEIMYATNSKFTSGKKTITITKSSTVSKKITKLKAKKKYYVKIRAYRTIGGKKYYSPWSKAKSKKTKK